MFVGDATGAAGDVEIALRGIDLTKEIREGPPVSTILLVTNHLNQTL